METKQILRKNGGEMYAFLIGTIIGLLIIGAMFFGYGIYKSGTSNATIFTALENLDIAKISTTKLNNKYSIDTSQFVVLKKEDVNNAITGLDDTKNYLYVVVSNDTPITTTGAVNISELSNIDFENILSKGVLIAGSQTDRVPRYFNSPVVSNDNDYTIYENSDTSLFASTGGGGGGGLWANIGEINEIEGVDIAYVGNVGGNKLLTYIPIPTETDPSYKWAIDYYDEPTWNNTTKVYDYPVGKVKADYPAFQYCEDLTMGGFNDWKLPNGTELKTMGAWAGGVTGVNMNIDNNRGLFWFAGTWTTSLKGGFSSSAYWSSSEFDSNGAYILFFSNGGWSGTSKGNSTSGSVRCVRFAD